MVNRTFNVLVVKGSPYIMMRESAERLSGNQRYEGFCIELIERLAEILQFNYTFVEAAGGTGVRDPATGRWSGMLRRLMDDPDAHFAITDLTITAERESAVDFTTPFMNLGISILFRQPTAPEPKFFSFLLPFSTGVWVCLGLAYVGSSLVLYVVGRLSPAEWQNPFPCVEEPEALHNQFTLANAFWFNLGAVLLQGSEIAPVAYSTRAAASAWWVFALVVTSSYTANLATLLARKSSDELISGVTDLAHNPYGIEYGAKAGGATYTFFEHSQNELYNEMFEHMKTKEMPTTNEEGIKKVMTENFAFLMESTTIDYETQRNCLVIQVGGLLDNKGYGIAMKKNSPYRQSLNLALLNLQERGELRSMKHKWWNEMRGGGACKEVEEYESAGLSMSNFLGLFVVLVAGCVLGVLGACAELAWRARRPLPAHPARSYWRRLAAELRFVFQFDRSVKPLHPPATPSSSASPAPASPAPATPAPATPAPASPPPPARSDSLRSRWSSRRRSSMAAASARRARHTSNAGL
ncbi:hypothetical protein JYU34_003974 [Plutella xylostella]|uniref:Uncharacterized protein n=1 Tax=Plutella xylostella TaxID=51655 RepID=A0ABQ7QWV3_PLUXY|nr:hypothetical protein JYU34_003974 [Plutella xylostella]